MPYDAARDLRGKHPRDTNNILVTTDGSMIFDGTGSQIINLSITASQAISAFYETSSSYADFADSSSYTTSASYSSASFSSSYSKTSSFAETFDHNVTGSVLFGDNSNVASISIAGSPSTGGKVGTITSNPAGLILQHAGGTIYMSNPVEMGINNINSTGTFTGTSSLAVSSSFAGFATSASNAQFSTSGSNAQFSTSASNAQFSTSGSNAQTSSYISPSYGAVSDVSNATGSSAGTAGFTDAAELGAFILAVSSSFETLNSLIAKLRAAGVIT